MPFIQYLYKLLISIFIVVSFDKGVVQLFLILLLNLLNIIYFAVIKPYYHKHHKQYNNYFMIHNLVTYSIIVLLLAIL
jgi:hypothetical protein